MAPARLDSGSGTIYQQSRTLDHISIAAKESQTGNEQHAFVHTPIWLASSFEDENQQERVYLPSVLTYFFNFFRSVLPNCVGSKGFVM